MKSTQDNHTPSLSLGVLLCGRTGIQRASLVVGGKESTCNTGSAGDSGSIPGSERSPGRRGNPLQYSWLQSMGSQKGGPDRNDSSQAQPHSCFWRGALKQAEEQKQVGHPCPTKLQQPCLVETHIGLGQIFSFIINQTSHGFQMLLIDLISQKCLTSQTRHFCELF